MAKPREDGDDRLTALLQFARMNGRVCPSPVLWDALHKLLPTSAPPGVARPGVPLIRGASPLTTRIGSGWPTIFALPRPRIASISSMRSSENCPKTTGSTRSSALISGILAELAPSVLSLAATV